MRDLNLNGIEFFDSTIGLDDVMIQLRDSCPDLEIIGLAHGTITSRGIDALAECRNLRELNILFLKMYVILFKIHKYRFFIEISIFIFLAL